MVDSVQSHQCHADGCLEGYLHVHWSLILQGRASSDGTDHLPKSPLKHPPIHFPIPPPFAELCLPSRRRGAHTRRGLNYSMVLALSVTAGRLRSRHCLYSVQLADPVSRPPDFANSSLSTSSIQHPTSAITADLHRPIQHPVQRLSEKRRNSTCRVPSVSESPAPPRRPLSFSLESPINLR